MEFYGAVLECVRSNSEITEAEILAIENLNKEGFKVKYLDRNLFSETYNKEKSVYVSWESFLDSLPEPNTVEYI